MSQKPKKRRTRTLYPFMSEKEDLYLSQQKKGERDKFSEKKKKGNVFFYGGVLAMKRGKNILFI